MLTLYSYPGLCGVADNNPFGLKVYAFMRLCGLSFTQKHILDTQLAPRGQLPYLTDDDHAVGDSDSIIAYLTRRFDIRLDEHLSPGQQTLSLLIRRTLDDLYWCMSYSRWKDERFWPQFRKIVLAEHPEINESAMEAAHDYNEKRYHFQGIGRYEPGAVYTRGIANLEAIANLLGDKTSMFGDAPGSIDAAIYGFVANIYFYDISTPLKDYVLSRNNLIRHCEWMHASIQR